MIAAHAQALVNMKTFIFALLVIGFVRGNEEDFKLIDSIVQEKPCRSAGGLCTIVEDCPKGHLSEKQGLCPAQREQGIDCCFGISLKETRCEKHGGSCVKDDDYCNPTLVYDGASDCDSDQKCCILV